MDGGLADNIGLRAVADAYARGFIRRRMNDGAVKTLGDALPMVNSAFRAYRYAADHPAFKGRDLTPKGTITERAAQGVDVYRQRRLPGDREAGKGSGDGRRGGREGQRGGGNPDEHPPSDGQREK